jgi:glutaredoxin
VIGLGVSGVLLTAGVLRYRALAARNVAPRLASAEPFSAPEPLSPPPRQPGADTARDMRDREAEVAAASEPAPATTPARATPTAADPEPGPQAPEPVSLSDVHLVVYTTSWCGVCRRAKSWMNSQGIAYEDRDVETSSENLREMRALNPRGSVPTFDVEGTVLVGFSERALVSSMQRAAQRRVDRRNY